MDSLIIEVIAYTSGIAFLMIGIAISMIPDTKWQKMVDKIL